LFKAAIKAVTLPGNGAPEPEVRKRRSGEKEGGGPLLVTPRTSQHGGRPAARGQYAKLRTRPPKTAAKLRRGFMRASADIVSPYADADLYILETLNTLNPCWPPPAGEHHAVAIDNELSMQQSCSFPQP